MAPSVASPAPALVFEPYNGTVLYAEDPDAQWFPASRTNYGNRRHDRRSPEDALLEIIDRTTARSGTVIIPSFAVGRAQSLLFHLYRLKAAGQLAA